MASSGRSCSRPWRTAGPSRMDYEKIIPLVHFLGETLSQALSEAFSGSPERDRR